MEKYRKIFSIVVIILFLWMAVANVGGFYTTITAELNEKDEEQRDYKTAFDNIEKNFKENLFGRNNWVDLYGKYIRTMGETIIGNFEYVLDQYGIIHMISDGESEQSIENFAKEVVKLKEKCEESETPFVYIQAPNRECVNQNTAIAEFNADDKVENSLIEKIKNIVDVLDIRKELESGDRQFDLKNLYFHTDLHMQTDAEIWMAKKSTEYLAKQYGIEIENKEYLSDKALYSKKSYPMLGSYGRNVGKLFTPLDDFVIYHPKTSTDFTMTIPGNEDVVYRGSFDEIILNNYENSESDEYTYWVIDFGKFSLPIYRYTNNKCAGPKLLIICDSIAYRALSYMSLTCSEITVLDPRYFNGDDYLKIAFEDTYDAVLLWQGVYLMNVPYIVK